MKKLYFVASIILVFVSANNAANVIGNTATQGNFALTVEKGTPDATVRIDSSDVEPRVIKKEDEVTFHFEVSLTKKEGAKILYIEEIAPAGYITKVVYTLKASFGQVITPNNFVMDIRNSLQFKYELTSGSLLSNVDVKCKPIKGGKYTMQLSVVATTKDGK
ncbi:MAG: hypothetical protein LBC74_12395 [Planctomycetaceae bacterium]|jgi:hypothetical protein|nr:hypothetical protein [Planctomycetaceae bacterium]